MDVSRETRDDLQLYQELLLKWNSRINLISRGEQHQLFERHFMDSLQILNLLPADATQLFDLGSGAGFPGLVLAIALKPYPEKQMTLIESNGKKCAFLREVARRTGANVRVANQRIEAFAQGGKRADVITSRALAPLEKLLELAFPLMHEATVCVFHKGQYVDDELTQASKYWNMSLEKHKSLTDPDGAILTLSQVDPKRR